MDLQPHLSVSQWLELPMNIRLRMRDIFAIPRSEGSSVRDGQVTSDGHTYRDLFAVSLEKMQAFLSDGDKNYYSLFQKIINRLSSEEKLSIDEFAEHAKTENIAKWTLVLKAIQKEAREYGLLELFNNLIKEIFFDEEKNAQPIQKTSNEGTKKRGRPAKKVS